MSADLLAAARQRLVVVIALLIEVLFERRAVPVLATLRPSDMRSGGARVPGTSYELTEARAVQAMQELLALQGDKADALLIALATADVQARYAALTAKPPPTIDTLYPHCTPDNTAAGSEAYRAALVRLYTASHRLFTLTQMRRIDKQLAEWGENPAALDAMPVQGFIALFVRNAPP
jgi:hypothetical protein